MNTCQLIKRTNTIYTSRESNLCVCVELGSGLFRMMPFNTFFFFKLSASNSSVTWPSTMRID